MPHYQICVVGAGMIGSAAAKYCGLLKTGPGTILIGPEEPEKEDYSSRDVFGAHYDQSRITRHLDADALWCHLAAESIKRYRSIESQSGISFFMENGYLCLFNSADDELKLHQDVAKSQSVIYRFLPDIASIKHRFPFLNPSPDTVGMYEPSKSGSINPRRLIKAQQLIAAKQGVTVMRDVVTNIEADVSVGFRVSTKRNDSISANKILLCVGAFLNHNELLPGGLRIDVSPALIMTVRFPVDEKLLKKLELMPSISMKSFTGRHFYLMAPVKYPDGNWYLKIGLHNDHQEAQNIFNSARDITDWYIHGPTKDHAEMKSIAIQILEEFIPGIELHPKKAIVDTCAVMDTPSVRPYVDQIAKNFYIVTGCNGYSAKSSDELGRLIAKLAITNLWDCPISNENFKCQFKKSVSKL